MTRQTKPLSFRVPADLADRLDVIARVQGRSVYRTIREAVDEYLAVVTDDPEFKKRLKDRIKKDAKLYRKLVEEQSQDGSPPPA